MDTEPLLPHPGFVYVIQAANEALVKIGHSQDPTARVRQLTLGAGGIEMRLLLMFVGSREAEAALHRRFEGYRLGGAREWFRLVGALASWLDSSRLPDINPDPPLWRFGAPAAGPEPPSAVAEGLCEVGQWMAEHVDRSPGSKVLASDLFASFQAWQRQRTHMPWTQRAFGSRLQELGLIRAGKDAGGRVQRIGGVLRASPRIVREQSNLQRPGTPTGEVDGND